MKEDYIKLTLESRQVKRQSRNGKGKKNIINNIPTGNIILKNEFIYAGTKLACEKIIFPKGTRKEIQNPKRKLD